MLQFATVDFQGFPATIGGSTRHGRDMGEAGTFFTGKQVISDEFEILLEAHDGEKVVKIAAGHVGAVLSALGRGHPCQHRCRSRRVDAIFGAVRAAGQRSRR